MGETVLMLAPIFASKCMLILFPINYYRMVLLTVLFGFNKNQHGDRSSNVL